MKKSVVHLAVPIAVMALLTVFVLAIGVVTSPTLEAAIQDVHPVSTATAIIDWKAGSGLQSNASNTGKPGDGEHLLQFTSAGHVLGFNSEGVTVASASHMLKTEFVGANTVTPEAGENSSAKPDGGRATPLGRVVYNDVWNDVSVVYEAHEGAVVKSTYYVNASKEGVPADRIRLRYNRSVNLDAQGNLVIAYKTGKMIEGAPVAWQEIRGQKRPVMVAYALYGNQEVGFSLGDYVPDIPVVIDPALTWNTFLGGRSSDYGRSITVDGSGNVYVAGYSDASWGSPVRAYTANEDAFAAKLDSSGNLTWNTFLGGNGVDYGFGIAVDSSGNVYVAGESDASWGSPVQPFIADNDAFAAKLDSNGNLTWNTFLGGSSGDHGYGIAVDGNGNVYVTGDSDVTWGSPVRPFTANNDLFAAKLDSSGNLTWNTFLGGNGDDYGFFIAVDGSGNVYVTGYSDASWGSPVRPFTANNDAFAAKLDSSGNLTWNTFFGGNGNDYGFGIAVDGSGNVYVAGYSDASWGSPVRAYTANEDAFAAKLDSSGNLTWNTFLGGSNTDYGYRIAVDGSRNVCVTGDSDASWGSPVRAYTANKDAFVAKLSATTPTVTTQTVSSIGTTTATGNGTITNLGTPNPTQHGVCWSTSENPTIALPTKTEQGTKNTTGAFTSNITGLSSNTTYHIRAYATNDAGTVYGADVSFNTSAQAPTITDFTPTSGGPGTSVKITGTGFTGTEVKFGGTDAARFTVDSETQITAVVGNGSTGNVTVTTDGGTATSAVVFTYIAPIPTLNEWAMLLFGLLLLSSAMLILRRRQKTI